MTQSTRRAVAVRTQPLAGPVDLLDLHRLNPSRYPFLLQTTDRSSGGHNRYDILFAFPGRHLVLNNNHLDGPCAAHDNDFLDALGRWYNPLQRPSGQAAGGLPFTGGWFFYLGYELAGQIEPGLQPAPTASCLPTALAVRCPAAVIRDHAASRTLLVCESDDCVPQVEQDVQNLRQSTMPPRRLTARIAQDAGDTYLQQVKCARDYIRAGDVFQVNLAREWRIHFPPNTHAADVYAALRRSNPSPFAGLMQWHNHSVISSSPERLLCVDGDRVQTRPIAGTRPRSGDDAAMTCELLAHPKERAEHVMLIDLERNDLGRVCRPGSISVDQFMTLESYQRVHHIVSNIRGRLRSGIGPVDALRAVFPGGTITGCPKVRCMEIIAELERVGRGAYTGAFGYLGRDGRLDSNILIRGLEQCGDHYSLRAGAGIVADSIPAQELAETRAKARGVLDAFATET